MKKLQIPKSKEQIFLLIQLSFVEHYNYVNGEQIYSVLNLSTIAEFLILIGKVFKNLFTL